MCDGDGVQVVHAHAPQQQAQAAHRQAAVAVAVLLKQNPQVALLSPPRRTPVRHRGLTAAHPRPRPRSSSPPPSLPSQPYYTVYAVQRMEKTQNKNK